MGPLVGSTELSKALIDAGNNLLNLHSSTDATLSLLDKIESLLGNVEQDPTTAIKRALMPSLKALLSADFLRSPDSDVRVSVILCLTEIMRISAPEAPFEDDQMKEIFQVTIEAFGKLADLSSRSYRKAEAILETVSKVRSSLVMLDLECDDLILEMFQQFLKIISPDHPQGVLLSMETIMITVIDESEEISMDLLEILLTTVRKESQDVSPMALRLVEKVFSSCALKLQPCIMEVLKSTGTSLDMYSPVISLICPNISVTSQAHSVVNAKENEADEKILEKKVIPSDSLEENLDLRPSSKGKRTARGGARQANGDDKVRSGNDYRQLFKQGQSESIDAETESGYTRKRRKPNSLMNPEEGYSFMTSSSKKVQEKELGDSSLGKLAAKKSSPPTKVGQTNQSMIISLSSSSRARTGSHKRSRARMEETNHDLGSSATPPSKKQIVKKDSPEEEDLMDSKLEKPKDSIKTAKSSKKERAQNGLSKTSAKKQIVKKDNPEEEDLMESELEKPEDVIETAKSSKKERAKNGLAKTSATKQILKKDNPVEEDLMDSELEKPEDVIEITKSSKKERAENGLAKKSTTKQIVKKGKLEKPEDDSKTAKSSKKERSQNGLAKASAKKPLAETKMVKASGKKTVDSDAKKKNSEGANTDKPIPESSKSKKKNSSAAAPSIKKSEQTPKSHPKRKRTSVEEVESDTNELGEELIGKRVNVWWPLDEMFYEGVIDSYCSLKKLHRVAYSDGDTEELNLKKEHFEIIQQDNSSAIEDKEIDLLESMPLSDFIKRKKPKKSKNVSTNVEPRSSPEVRSPVGSMKKKGSVTDSIKQAKRTKGAFKAVSNEPESSEGKNLKSLEKLNGEPGRTKVKTSKKQVTRATQRESEKDCNEKEGPEAKGEDNLKFGKESNAEPDCKEEHEELPENQNAKTKADGEEQKSAKEPNAKTETDGKERRSVEEPNAEPITGGEEQEAATKTTVEPKTDEEKHKVAKETNAECETDEEEHKSAEEPNAEPRTDGGKQMSVKEPSVEPKSDEEEQHKVARETNAEPETEEEEPNVEPRTDGEEQMSMKEPSVKPKTDEEEHKVAKETNAEPEIEEEEQKSLEETNVEPKTEGEERMSLREPNAETGTKVEEKVSKLMENVDMYEANGEEINKETCTSMSETGKVENEDQRVIEELKEESGNPEVGTRPGSG